MREGMRGKAGIGKVSLYGREYLVAVKPQEHGLVMYTLHHAAEMRGIDQVEELDSVPKTVKPDELKLAKQVVETFAGDLNLAEYRDEYKEELRRIIDAKVAGEEVVAAPVAEPPSNVVDLMAALRKSLDAVSVSKKATAKADFKKKADGKRKRALFGPFDSRSRTQAIGPGSAAVGSPSHAGGVSQTNARIATTIRSYCHVARSYVQ